MAVPKRKGKYNMSSGPFEAGFLGNIDIIAQVIDNSLQLIQTSFQYPNTLT